MLKQITLKRMALKTEERISFNKDLFEKFGTEVNVVDNDSHLCITEVNGINHIIPYGLQYSFKSDSGGTKHIIDFRSITLCMNSVYEIAKVMKRKPMEVLDDVLDSLFKGLSEAAIYPEISVPIPKYQKSFIDR